MRKALKRSLSLLLAITIIFGSVYAGLSEVDWGSAFALKASAADMGDDCIKIILTWGANPKDLDSHVSGTLADGTSFHCYYQNKNIYYDGDLVVNLDKDDTSSYGPETTTITLDPSVFDGEFTYYVYNYSGTGSIPGAGATVSLYKGDTFIGAYDASGSSSGRYWSLFYIKNGIIYLVDEIGSSVSKNINESTDAIGSVWGEVFNTPERIDPNSYAINVKAYNSAGNAIPAVGADVTVYSGADAILTKQTNGAGNVIFTKNELLEKGVDETGLSRCTVSAHLDAGEITLCSEEVLDNGVWAGENLLSCKELTCAEPRWYVDNVTVAYMYRSGYLSKLESRMEQFAAEFAKTTNGHVIINEFSYIPCSSNSSVDNQTDADIRINDKGRIFDICRTGAATIGMLNRNDISSGIGLTLNNYIYGNGEFDPYISINWNDANFVSTLCHEAGHYFLGFFDEYCYGLGYDYDADGDGVIEDSEKDKNYGNWTTHEGNAQNGKVPRPGGAPRNFGLMDVQWASSTSKEISTRASYNYLDELGLRSVDESQPEMYTKQYFVLHGSCEEKLAYELDFLANSAGYSTSYGFAENGIQNASYDYVSVSHSYYSADTTYTLTDEEKNIYSSAESTLNCLDELHFSYDEGTLTITKNSNDTYVFMENISDDSVIACPFDENNQLSFDSSDAENCVLSVIKKIDGTYYKNEYSISFVSESEYNDNIVTFTAVEGEETVLISYDVEIENDDYNTTSSVYKVVTDSETNVEGSVSACVGADAKLNLSTASWFIKQNDVWFATDTNYSISEHGECLYTADFSGSDITLALMAKQPADAIYEAPTNLTISADDTIYDGQVKVTFDDSNNDEDIRSYIVYYSDKPFDVVNEELKSTVMLSGTKECYVSLDEIGKEHYFAVVAVGNDGARSQISEIDSYTPKHIDSDSDGIPDYWLDIYYQLKEIENIAYTDSDSDGLTNLKEYKNGTNPLNPDTDGDNVYDAIEIDNSLNPLKKMTDGKTDDYAVIYGAPDLKVTDISFDDNYIYFNVANGTNGKAMRTIVNVTNGNSTVASWTVNIDSQSVVGFSFERKLLETNTGFKIEVDGSQCTRDIDYSNNSFEYVPATSITLEDITMVKGFSTSLEFTCEPITANEVVKWRRISGTDSISFDEETGVVSSSVIGQATIQVETMGGLTAECTVTAIPFEGANYTEFDCELINDGTEVAITNYIGTDTDIIIPSLIGGLPVTQLNDDCIPSGVTNVTVPASVSVIGYSAFYSCGTLSYISVDENNNNYSSADGVLFNKDKTELILYPRDKADSKYDVPNGVIVIMNGAFEDCANLNTVTISDSVECIGDFAFWDCINLDSITVSDSVTSIGYGAFSNCINLTTITVDENNTNYSSADGVLFNKDKTILIQYPAGKSDVRYAIPDCVIAIDDVAFMGCGKLSGIVISDNLESIGEEAITNCSSFKYVFYQGSESDWANVSIGIDNGSLTTAKIHYNSTDHTYEYKVDKESTCIEQGSKHKECIICAHSMEAEAIPATGHDYSTEWTIDLAPTCTKEGSKSHHCTVCSDKTDITTVESNGHSYSDEWTIDIAPTCTTEGSKSHHCIVCGDKTDITVIATVDHEIIEDICKCCGFSEVWEYEITDGFITINKYNGSSSEIVIPDSIVGVPVKAIGENAFYNCADIVSITIPGGVTTIGNYAFYNCSALTSIEIPDNVTTIGNYAFSSCSGLTSIVIPDSVTNVGVGAFYECGFLKSVVMSKNITEINESTFYNCYYLASFTIPDGVTVIGNTAFYGCMRLQSVEVPDSVTSIGNGAFSGCKKLNSLDIGEHVSSIGNSAFYNCTNLTSITIPDSVTTINPYTFYNCKNISYVVISDVVTGIGKNAFYGFTGTIYCVEDSVAHEYAVENSIAYVLLNALVNGIEATNTQIDYSNFIIRTSAQGCNDISEIIGKSQSAIIVATPSYEYNELKIYGTGTTIAVFDGDNFIGEFTVVVDCDINGDSVVDVLDSSQMALASSGKKTLDGTYALAADSNSDDLIDISDYQDVVNKAVS